MTNSASFVSKTSIPVTPDSATPSSVSSVSMLSAPMPSSASSPDSPLLTARGVDKYFGRGRARRRVLFGVDLDVNAGECLAVIGASGSGKSTLTRIMLGLESADAGTVTYAGQPVQDGGTGHGRGTTKASAMRRLAGFQALRRESGLVFQDPFGSLDPRWTVARSVSEPLALRRGTLHGLRFGGIGGNMDAVDGGLRNAAGMGNGAGDKAIDAVSEGTGALAGRSMRDGFGHDRSQSDEPLDGRHMRDWLKGRAARALATVGLEPDEFMDRYPVDLSGGQAQRVAIARAIVAEPRVILADEPMSAIDVAARIQILDAFAAIRAARPDMALIMVSHDLGVVQHIADRIVVLHDGRIEESGPTSDILSHPQADYTKQLISAATL